MLTKLCNECKETKDTELCFYKNRGVCKGCYDKRTKKWQKTHPEQVKAIDKKSKDARRELIRLSNALYYQSKKAP